MNFSKLYSYHNLRLAWNRILTGKNLQYKRYFREMYYQYEVSSNENLKYLSKCIRDGTYSSQKPLKFFIPKSSGLHRPITLLYLEDQIVLQAISNLYEKKLKEKRSKFERKQVFGNLLMKEKNSPFFFEDWHISYNLFNKKKVDIFKKKKKKWIVEFDLASFYDIIPHDLLLKSLFPRAENDLKKIILKCLETWTSNKEYKKKNHGLPQGPIASDFLAECFLLDIDQTLKAEGITYIRYCDDFYLFSESESKSRQALKILEFACREKGLIPQEKKLSIKKYRTIKELSNLKPSSNPSYETSDNDYINERRALKLLGEAIKDKKVKDKSKLRYVFYRVRNSKKALKFALDIAPFSPEHIDTLIYQFQLFPKDEEVLKTVLQLFKTSPYEHVRGECLILIADRMEMLRFSQRESLKENAIEISKDKKAHFSLKLGALLFLCNFSKLDDKKYSNFLINQEALMQAFLISSIPDFHFQNKNDKLISRIFERNSFEPSMMLSMKFLGKKWIYGRKNIPVQTENTFKELGVKLRYRNSDYDPVAELLCKRYGIQDTNTWKCILDKEYSHALGILKSAESVFVSGKNHWLSQQDSFNDLVFRSLCKRKGKSTLDKNEKELSYGVLLNKFKPNFSRELVSGLMKCHERRNSVPSSHPYNKKTGKRATYLRKGEQNDIIKHLKKSYDEILKEVSLFREK